MVKMTAPHNMGSVQADGQTYAPDENGCLYVPDDLDVNTLEVLRSHGYTLVGWVPDAPAKKGKTN